MRFGSLSDLEEDLDRMLKIGCHTQFWKGTECISYVRQDQVHTHMIDDTQVYIRNNVIKREYWSTLLHDRKS
jgi:hypothetical protein